MSTDGAGDLDNVGFALGTDYTQFDVVGTYNTTIAIGTATDNNYDFTPLNTSTFAVGKKELTISNVLPSSFTAFNKIFDGTKSAIINEDDLELVGLVNSDAVDILPVAEFESVGPGSMIVINLVAASSLSGADKDNYTLSVIGAPTTTATIYPAGLEITLADGTILSGTQSVTENDQFAYKVVDKGTGYSYSWALTNMPPNQLFTDVNNDYLSEVLWITNGVLTVREYFDDGITGPVLKQTGTLAVTVTQIALKGTIKYNRNNLSHTPLSGVTVRLKDGASVLASTTTDATGYYEFFTVDGSTNTIEISTDMAWGGGNSTDALAIQRRQLGNYPTFYAPGNFDFAFRDKAGDANANGWVNATDALLVKRRAIQLVTSFTAGDWAFWNQTDNAFFTNTSAGTATIAYTHTVAKELNILAMAYGDVNASYTVVPSAKTMTAVNGKEVMDVSKNKVISLPVRINTDTEIGAVTLFMKYADRLITVKGLKTTIPGLIYNIADGYINVAWSGVEANSLPTDGTIFTLVLEANQSVYQWDALFSIDSRTQVADLYCNVLDNVTFEIARLNTKSEEYNVNFAEDFSVNCYPNPVKENMTISYALPVDGKVSITVVNSMGEKVLELFNQDQVMGTHSLQFNPGSYSLPNGVYYCRITVNGVKASFNEVVRIVYMN